MPTNSTKDILYIPGEVIDFDELLGEILNHFGVDAEITDFKLYKKRAILSRLDDGMGITETYRNCFVVERR